MFSKSKRSRGGGVRERERPGPCENKATCGLDFLVFFFSVSLFKLPELCRSYYKTTRDMLSKPTFKDCFQLTDELIVVLEENLHEQ